MKTIHRHETLQDAINQIDSALGSAMVPEEILVMVARALLENESWKGFDMLAEFRKYGVK